MRPLDRTCKVCGDPFTVAKPKSRRECCSKTCQEQAKQAGGVANPGFAVGKTPSMKPKMAP